MKMILLLIGPTIMMYIGLYVIENVAATFLLFYGWLLGAPLIGRAFPKERMQLSKQGFLLGIVSGVVFFVFIFGGMIWLHEYLLDVESLRELLVYWGFIGPGEIWLVLVLLLLNPVLEEVYWRGYMFEKIRIKGSAAITITVTAAFYTLYHVLTVMQLFEVAYTLVAVLPVLIAGLFWGYIRERTGSITATIIGHGLGDLGIVCVYWFIVR
ncbi:CPBP family intramembrane glutamic endopeptidase [Planococcus halotolerans]|uniref:CPBP family intramembrane metalloprotease n=1 Tax=Planococcus halotolerans TaxID=2233542 RepID=A0A365KWV5_9BACL|nr:CPBP family intramembrane glutamic endopeptidase [Planococcus halotolerans]QHJ69134.1 CPBP family intramembrane metalloprotease [Planococcus halotolerans]RAZ77666.1 CPBP family intramembrane metalloprotease [Planococcus halotolerans]